MDDATTVGQLFFSADAVWQCHVRHMSSGGYICTDGTTVSVENVTASLATLWTVTNKSGTMPTNLTDHSIVWHGGNYTNENPVLQYTITTQHSGQTIPLAINGTTAEPDISLVSPPPSISMRLNR